MKGLSAASAGVAALGDSYTLGKTYLRFDEKLSENDLYHQCLYQLWRRELSQKNIMIWRKIKSDVCPMWQCYLYGKMLCWENQANYLREMDVMHDRRLNAQKKKSYLSAFAQKSEYRENSVSAEITFFFYRSLFKVMVHWLYVWDILANLLTGL